MNVYRLSKLFYYGQHILAWHTPNIHEQYSFIIYVHLAGKERDNSQQVSLLIELKSISMT